MKQKSSFLDFFTTVGKSKRLLRTGWVRERIFDPETVAEHSFRVGVLAMVLADKFEFNVDKEKLIKMALLHDLGEVITGDMVTTRGEVIDLQAQEEKEVKEKEGIREIFKHVGKDDEYVHLFEEMIGRGTVEAKLFWQLDKLEMAIQAFEYEKEQNRNLEEFFVSVSLYLKEPMLKDIFRDIIRARRHISKNLRKY